MTEGGGLTTVCALSHFLGTSFLAMIPVLLPMPFPKAEHFTIDPRLSQGKLFLQGIAPVVAR